MLLEMMNKDELFSRSELLIRDFLFKEKEMISFQTASEIAAKNYVSASTMTRFAKKLDYLNWNQFKSAFLNELSAKQGLIKGVDSNFPFQKSDTAQTVAKKLAVLKQETVNETLNILNPDTLNKAVKLIQKQNRVHIFASIYSLLSSHEFCVRMTRIGKLTSCNDDAGLNYIARCLSSNDLAIVVSYSGKTGPLVDLLPIFKKNRTPIIAITGDTPNLIHKASDIQIIVPNSENQYSKISNYAANDATRFVFDILYSLYFSQNYEKNLIEREKFAVNVDKKI